ncbi:uncharacterized protein LOC135203713 [Macrobrachium nipponense]|uniref:uncharacterized protein LOC135203713 n=1 Tax=Macrobrachium nipponense TaxID=159736 RepID=UPI0030C80C92
MDAKILLLLALATFLSTVSPLPAKVSVKPDLENAFDDRAVVESIIDCFTGKANCSPQEKKIKDRAMATMKNLGRCPDSFCTEQERTDMTHAMELLQTKHPDLWTKLIASMFGIPVSKE